MITVEKAKIVLDRFAGGKLLYGAHERPNGECRVCVEELRTLMRYVTWDGDEPTLGRIANWTDRPDGGTPTERTCQRLNDGPWSSDEARTSACLKLVTLSEKDAAPGWAEKYRELTIRHIVSLALESAARVHPDEKHQVALLSVAAKCRAPGTMESALEARGAAYDAGISADADISADIGVGANYFAYFAIAYAAADAHAAAYAAAIAYDATDAHAAAYAAAAGANVDAAAERDRILRLGVELLMAAHQGREPNLWALGLSEFAYATNGSPK